MTKEEHIKPQLSQYLKNFFSYCLLVLLWCTAGLIYRWCSDGASPAFLVIGVLFFGAPVFVAGFYGAAVKNVERSLTFKKHGFLYGFATSRWLPAIWWIVVASISGFLITIWFAGIEKDEWISIAVLIASFYGFFIAVRRLTRSELQSFVSTQRALVIASRCATAVAALIYFLLAINTTEQNIEVEKRLLELGGLQVEDGTSFLLQLAVYVNQYLQIIREGIVSWALTKNILLQVLIVAFGSAGLFWSASLTLSCFALTRIELRRLFSANENNGVPAAVQPVSAFFFSCLAVFVAFFIILPSILQSENYARSKTGQLENCDGQISLPGTCHEVAILDFKFRLNQKKHQALLANAVRSGFDKLRANADAYLDYYYSVPAEYGRIGSMLVGKLENRVHDDMKEYLEAGDPFSELDARLVRQSKRIPELVARYEAERAMILRDGKVDELPLFAKIHSAGASKSIVDDIDIRTSIDLSARAGAGAISGVVAFAVTKNLVAKGTLKLAASAFAKAAASKSAAAVAGGAAGAALGSLVPGAGTLIGSVLGAGVGLLSGVGVDYLMLILEEEMNRDDFRRQIIQSIDEEESRVLARISPMVSANN